MSMRGKRDLYIVPDDFCPSLTRWETSLSPFGKHELHSTVKRLEIGEWKLGKRLLQLNWEAIFSLV